MRLAISGATGYIGQRLMARARAAGYDILALSRRRPSLEPIDWMPFDLADADPLTLPLGVKALVHLAATTKSASFDEEGELNAAKRLIEACGSGKVTLIFVSSQTARADAPTSYGRAKWAIERAFLKRGGTVIRAGLVYGGPERGLFGAVITLARRLPALPAFWPPPYVQPVHVDDLVEALLTVAIRTDLAGAVLSIGAASPVSFTDFLRALARSRLRKRRAFIPTPRFAIGAARLFVGSTISSRLGLDRLESLFTLPMMDTAKDLRRLGLTLRPLETGLARGANGVRRARIAEGRAMLAYVLRAPPRSALVRRYVRAIERLRGGAPLPLPDLALRRPACLALFDGAGATRGELGWRLDAAVALAEASPQGAKRFLRSGLPSGFLKAALALSLAAFCELTWRGAALLSWPLLRRWKACR